MKRSTKCIEFLEYQSVQDVSMINSDDDGNFRSRGCACCDNGLGTTVYDCHGYSPKYNEVLEVGEVCGECLNYFYNGEDSDLEDAV